MVGSARCEQGRADKDVLRGSRFGRTDRPCGSPLTVVADGAGVIESVCGAGHRYATCACQQPDRTGWKAINVGIHYPGIIP